MSWELVAQTLILLAAGVGAQKWIAREPRPIVVRAAKDPIQESLEKELEQLTDTRDKLLREQTVQLGDGLVNTASYTWKAVVNINKQIESVRLELSSFPDKG